MRQVPCDSEVPFPVWAGAWADLEFCGNGEVGEPGVLRTSCAQDCVPHGPSFLLLSRSLLSPPLPHSPGQQKGWLLARVGRFLSETQVCFPLPLLTLYYLFI